MSSELNQPSDDGRPRAIVAGHGDFASGMVEANVRVIFTDLQAGSCTMASRRILRGMDDAVLIAGANLPTLLDFVFAEGRSAPEAARHAAERGRAAICVHGAGA
jgi:PTS system N-acetylgalactosamine-specific IIA component